MKAIWKKIYTNAASPFRLIVFIFLGPGQGQGHLAGRYTKPVNMKDFEPSADYLLG